MFSSPPDVCAMSAVHGPRSTVHPLRHPAHHNVGSRSVQNRPARTRVGGRGHPFRLLPEVQDPSRRHCPETMWTKRRRCLVYYLLNLRACVLPPDIQPRERRGRRILHLEPIQYRTVPYHDHDHNHMAPHPPHPPGKATRVRLDGRPASLRLLEMRRRWAVHRPYRSDSPLSLGLYCTVLYRRRGWSSGRVVEWSSGRVLQCAETCYIRRL
jgi:hypothetical protein